MSDAAAPTLQDEMEIIAGGRVIEVTHLPIDEFDELSLKRLAKFQPLLGTVERVKIYHVPVTDLQRYGLAILNRDEATAIECYCRRDPGWAETLTHESVNLVADKGLELNLDFFGAWFDRQAKWKEVQTPTAIRDLQKTMAELLARVPGSLSPSSSAASPTTTG